MGISKEYLLSIGCVEVNGEHILRIGAANMTLRMYSDRCYCQLPDLYVGEITKERLSELYFGLTGNRLKET